MCIRDRSLHRRDLRFARLRAARDLDRVVVLARLGRDIGANLVPVMREVAHHRELALLELRAVDDVARGTALAPPDRREGLQILRTRGGEELFDSKLRG